MILSAGERLLIDLADRHRVTIPEAIPVAAFSGQPVSRVVSRLVARELIREVPLPGNRKAIALDRKGASVLNLPPKRAALSSNIKAIGDTLATTWHCCLSDAARFRLTFEEMRELIGAEPPKGPVFVLDTAERVVNRIYVPGDTADALVLRQVGRWQRKASKHQALAPALESGELGITCLVGEPERVDDLAAKVRDTYPSLRASVAYAPPIERLSEALTQRSAS